MLGRNFQICRNLREKWQKYVSEILEQLKCRIRLVMEMPRVLFFFIFYFLHLELLGFFFSQLMLVGCRERLLHKSCRRSVGRNARPTDRRRFEMEQMGPWLMSVLNMRHKARFPANAVGQGFRSVRTNLNST